ncbi:MAG: hypothetical protein GDA36_13695 [Rhodobacteraceae bacterium]|nr:hypothetical protein [Paracoccaceae bacterium]
MFIQISAEEALFQGYVQQQRAARFSPFWVWMLIPSPIFTTGYCVPEQARDDALAIAV